VARPPTCYYSASPRHCFKWTDSEGRNLARALKRAAKASAADCIVVYHNCATSAASLRFQSSLSIESLRSGIGKRNNAMISLTQCLVLGGLGSNEAMMGIAPCAKHHSLLLSYLFNLKRGLAFVRDMIIVDLRSSIDVGAMQQAADLLVVLRLFFSEYPEAAYVPRGCGFVKRRLL